MTRLLPRLASLRTDIRALTLLEYGLIAGIVVAVGMVTSSFVGTGIAAKFTKVAAALT